MKSIPKLIIIQFLLYFIAGINHFINPQFYLRLMPPYIPYHETMVWLSGIAEMLLAILLLFQPTRKFASVMIVFMLLVFISVHIYYIQINSCNDNDCLLFWLGWIRLLVVQPMLIYWAWKAGKYTNK